MILTRTRESYLLLLEGDPLLASFPPEWLVFRGRAEVLYPLYLRLIGGN